ncbi:MAG TPA: hemolysin family protein [Bryobacteraceae bacterium]|nr:hemolysin family protein [Bryobacteraceae bacterium]
MSYRILIMLGLLALNGFFAAAEVALVSVRQSRLKALAKEGQVGALAALSLLANPERLLSVTQVGVTLASLGLGWAGENTLYQIVTSVVHPVLSLRATEILHGATFGLAFLLMSFAHVVIGEVAPKNIAIDKADQLAMLVAPPLLVFYRLSEPFVYVIEHSASALSRALGGKRGHRGGGHSVEELKFIISSSRREGHLESFEEATISRVLDLEGYAVREIMVPRNDLVSLPVDAGIDQVLNVMLEHQYSRVPVYEDSREKIIGIVHYKDLMRVWMERKIAMDKRQPLRPFQLRRLMRKPLVVPETKPISQLIDEFRESHTHMALVVDEFGTIVGLVTLEDALEQIFGEIGDEHDIKRVLPLIGAPMVELDGGTTIRDLEMQYRIDLPSEAGFETLAGFLLFRFGYIPKVGESVAYGPWRFTVLEMDRNRIAHVRIERLQAAPATSGASTAGPS